MYLLVGRGSKLNSFLQATPLDYMIQMNYEPNQDNLVLSAGTFDGKVLLARILPDDIRPFRMVGRCIQS